MEKVGNAYHLPGSPERTFDDLNKKRLVKCQPIHVEKLGNSHGLRRSEKLIHVQNLVREERWINCTIFREQISVAAAYLIPKGWRLYAIAQLFGCDRHTITVQLQKANEPHPDGRPPKLNDTELELLHDEILRLHSVGVKPTINDMQRFVYDSTGKNIITNTLYKIIRSNFPDFKTVTGKPMESDRCDIADEDIDNYYVRLNEAIKGVPVNLIYNIDEAGEDDFIDAKAIRVIVPASFEHDYAEIPVKRERVSEQRSYIAYQQEAFTYPQCL